MSEDRNDGLGYLLFLAASIVVVMIVIGWFAVGPDRKRSVARDCNTVALTDRRDTNCLPSEDRSRD
jgi:hypothetical protein